MVHIMKMSHSFDYICCIARPESLSYKRVGIRFISHQQLYRQINNINNNNNPWAQQPVEGQGQSTDCWSYFHRQTELKDHPASLKWCGHQIRINNGTKTKRVFETRPEGRGKRGIARNNGNIYKTNSKREMNRIKNTQ